MRSAATTLRSSAAGALALMSAIPPAQADTTRTFPTEVACAKAAGLGAGICRQIFAAARAEFEAKTRSYPNRFSCYRAYGPCMPWPVGPAPLARFRPQWMGAAVSGPVGQLVTVPVVAPGRVALPFAPRPPGDASVAVGHPVDHVHDVLGPGSAPAQLCREIAVTAEEAGLPPRFLARLLWQESSFRADVVSSAGALGIAQFMPATAEERGLADPFDAARAIEASARLLGDLARRFGNLGLAAAAYNGGPARVSDWLKGEGSLAAETQDYVQRITGRPVEEWASGAAGGSTPLAAPCRFGTPPADAVQP